MRHNVRSGSVQIRTEKENVQILIYGCIKTNTGQKHDKKKIPLQTKKEIKNNIQ